MEGKDARKSKWRASKGKGRPCHEQNLAEHGVLCDNSRYCTRGDGWLGDRTQKQQQKNAFAVMC